MLCPQLRTQLRQIGNKVSIIVNASIKYRGRLPDSFAPAVSRPVPIAFAISCMVTFFRAISARKFGYFIFAFGMLFHPLINNPCSYSPPNLLFPLEIQANPNDVVLKYFQPLGRLSYIFIFCSVAFFIAICRYLSQTPWQSVLSEHPLHKDIIACLTLSFLKCACYALHLPIPSGCAP